MVRLITTYCLLLLCGCRSDVAQQDAMALARSRGADVRISINGDAQRVDLRRCRMDDELMSALKQMPAIETLLVGKTFSDADVDLIENRTTLKNLDLSHSLVTAAAFEKLANLRQLEFLSLNGLKISDADMVILSKLRQLRSVSFIDCRVSETALKHFRQENPDCTVAR